ncbi:MAG: cation transporter [bacterium]
MKEEKNHRKSEIKKGVTAGFWSGILASLCCIGPLVIILFGSGTVSFALSISQYKPYFLGLAFLFMVSAIVLHLRKKNKTCGIHCFSLEGLKREKPFILSVILSMVIIYVLSLYVVMPTISPIIYGQSGETASLPQTGKTVNPINENSNLHLLSLKINGMTCAGCAYGIQSILESLDGVVKAKVNYPEGTASVIYDADKITKEEIANSLESSYSAEVIKDGKNEL